jgi:hypothetical protein
LDDGAARSGKPTKTLSRRQLANCSGFRATRANPLESEKMFFYFRDFQIISKGAKPIFVKLKRSLQKFLRLAVNNYADVQKFFAFDARHKANNGILK